MSARNCVICRTKPEQDLSSVCAGCVPISRICCTSAEDGVKYGIPGTSLDDLKRALRHELTNSRRVVVVKALERAIKLAQRGPDMARKEGCRYFGLSPDRVSNEPKFPKPLGQLCDAASCSIHCGRKAK